MWFQCNKLLYALVAKTNIITLLALSVSGLSRAILLGILWNCSQVVAGAVLI